ncbi:AMP-binding protein [Novosphingobium sp. G106]|uniref:AMP-binding protein n=1 Tax=Novosphingobium sp. G106 TaxID=2849500 RepID=UPI001C2CC883|nr:AMP-binding protein [Novosphingobium sp. G106]MBV1688936.1 AMP-binding protein [Novosphingobium sp. G106]
MARTDDGSLLVWDDIPLAPIEQSLAHIFASRAAEVPERILVAKRGEDGGDWVTISYGEMFTRARRIAGGLEQRGFVSGDRLLCLSGETIDHLAFLLGAMLAGLVTVPISVRYSTASDWSRLNHVIELIRPQLVFADDSPAFRAALDHCALAGYEVLDSGPQGLAALEATARPIDIDKALAAIGPETVFRILLTSGSTAMPKGALQTHGMSCASLAFEASLSTGAAGLRAPENELSWLPWSHVGGSITVFNNVLYAGRSLYLDDGKPLQGHFAETVRNLKELMPHEFSSPPAGLVMLVPELEADAEFCNRFLSGLHYTKSGAAALPDAVSRRFQALAIDATGHEIPVLSGYGTTETHGVISLTWPCNEANALGLPKPGVLLKLVPEDDRYEIRIRCDSVTPGYFDAPEATSEAFDEEGFFLTGDMARFDPEKPENGLYFAGRSGENFKMATGTWVLAGQLRMALLDTLEGLINECLVVGEGQEELGLIIWGDQARKDEVEQRMRAFNQASAGASQRIARLVFSELPIDDDRFERTEKGSLNRNRILATREEELRHLFRTAASTDDRVLLLR